MATNARRIGYPAQRLPEWVRPPFVPGSVWYCTDTARKFHASKAMVKAVLGGLGAAKTTTLCAESIYAGFANPGHSGILFEPTFPLVRDTLRPSLERMLEAFGLRRGRDWTHHATEWSWKVLGGAERGGFTILGRGATEWERIVGMNLAWVGLDEPARMAREVLTQARARVRVGPARRVFLTGTPDPGTWVSSWIANPPEGAAIFHAATDENPWISQDYLEMLEQEYDSKALEAYRHGRPVLLTGTAYHAFVHADWPAGNLRPWTYDPSRPVILTLDNNRTPLAACLLQQDGAILQQFAEVALQGGSWSALAEAVHARLGEKAPPGIILSGDAVLRGAVHDTATDWGAFQAVAEQLARVMPGVRVQLRCPKANPLVITRLETVNRLLCNAKGERRLLIDPSCRETIADCQLVSLDKDGGIEKRTDKKRSHWMDAAGYYACEAFPLSMPSGSRRPMLITASL